jgi:L-aspartate oxidase
MLTLARAMVVAATKREESRGVHLRTDFPAADDTHWLCRIWFRRDEATGEELCGQSGIDAAD